MAILWWEERQMWGPGSSHPMLLHQLRTRQQRVAQDFNTALPQVFVKSSSGKAEGGGVDENIDGNCKE